MSDDELELLKTKKLRELQARSTPPAPRETLVSHLGHRGLEVLEAAEVQFPSQMSALVPRLAALASSGELGRPDGGMLLHILRMAGLRVRMPTKINVQKNGRFVTLAEKLGGDRR